MADTICPESLKMLTVTPVTRIPLLQWWECVKLSTKLSDVVDFHSRQDDKYYYTPEKCKFYDELVKDMTSQNTIYQWRRRYVRANKSGVCPTLTANMGTGGHNVPLILTDHGIRKLTPRETFNIQGFPSEFVLPSDMSDARLYKCAGNSVVVPVIRRIAESMLVAIEKCCKTQRNDQKWLFR